MKKAAVLILALALCAGLGVPALAAAGFSDVAADSPFAPAIVWAVEQGVTKGTTPTTFGPGNTCTTSHILTFLWRAAGRPGDAGEERAAVSAWASGLGIDVSDLSAPCTRAAAVTDIWKSQGSPAAKEAASFTDVAPSAPYAGAVSWAVEAGVTNGTGGGAFSPEAVCTRGQIVTFLYRALGESKAAETPAVESSIISAGPTLSNGKPITEENVQALLDELKDKYPDGTLYAPVGTKISTRIYGSLGFVAGTQCAGWAALASDYIFGKTGVVRTHKNFTQIRLGDVFFTKGHTSVIIGTERCTVCGGTLYSTCDSGSAYVVYWTDTIGFCPTCTLYRCAADQNPTIITRYPVNSTVPYLPYTKGSGDGSTFVGNTGTSSGTTGSSSSTPSTPADSSSSGSSASPGTASSSYDELQALLDAPCPLCGKTGGSSTFNDAMTKKVCGNCYNTNRAAARAYLDS